MPRKAKTTVETQVDDVSNNNLNLHRFKVNPTPLASCHSQDTAFEIGIDEAGRGPLFGPVFVAAVVLPKDLSAFHHEWMRDSKQIKNKKNI